MSVRTMARVWEGSQHSGSELLMLLAIADFADDDGRAYPSISRLARKCRVSSRYAIALLDALSQSGELEIKRNAGPVGQGGRTNLYRIALNRLGESTTEPVNPASPPGEREAVRRGSLVNSDSVVNQGSGSGELGFREVVSPSSPKPSGNHQEPSEVASPKVTKGSRLSPSWQPSSEDLAYCQRKRPDLDPVETAEGFRDYWIAQAGSKAVKADWSATWRTWVRNQHAKPALTKAQASGQAWEGAR